MGKLRRFVIALGSLLDLSGRSVRPPLTDRERWTPAASPAEGFQRDRAAVGGYARAAVAKMDLPDDQAAEMLVWFDGMLDEVYGLLDPVRGAER